jgi:two-component sensor histidine kinase
MDLVVDQSSMRVCSGLAETPQGPGKAFVTDIGGQTLMSRERERPPPRRKITSELDRLRQQLTTLEERFDTLPEPHHPALEEAVEELATTLMVGTAFWNPSGQGVEANDAFLQVIGYTREDLLAGCVRADAIHNPHLLALFQDSQHRVHAMALIHEQLYQAEDLSHIAFADYIRRLATQVVRSYPPQASRVTVRLELVEVTLAIDQVIPCGLILNELLTNSLKYAFPDEQTGEICIRVHMEAAHTLQLTASDTGVGFPPELDFRHTDSLGLQLVCTLAEQLHATIVLECCSGTSFTLTVPIDPSQTRGGHHGHGADSHC